MSKRKTWTNAYTPKQQLVGGLVIAGLAAIYVHYSLFRPAPKPANPQPAPST